MMKTDTQVLIEKLRVLADRMDVLRIQSAKDVAEAADQLQELFIQNRDMKEICVCGMCEGFGIR